MIRFALFILLAVLPMMQAQEKAVVVKFGDLTATAPKEWVSEKPANRLRSNQFKLASGDKDVADAEVAVFPESNPDTTKNWDRWKATVTPAEGVSPEDAYKTNKFEVKGAIIHTLDMNGTWKFKERPQDPKSKEEIRPEYRVIWVIVVGKDEATHVRFSGPTKVVEKHHKEFEGFLKGLK